MSFPNLPLLFLFTLPLFLTSIHAASLRVRNQCSYTVWATATPGGGRRLHRGQSWNITVSPNTTAGHLWGRTSCRYNSSRSWGCQTGDCGGLYQCQQSGQPPYTLAEYTLNQSKIDYFHISLVDGFNIPMDFRPINGNCKRGVRCSANINDQCPSELKAPGGCNNPCTVFNTSEYCCTSGNCGPTTYSMFFKERCPNAYSYPKDDENTTFTCPTGTDYRVAFCPGEPLFLGRPIIISVTAASGMALLVFCMCYYLTKQHAMMPALILLVTTEQQEEHLFLIKPEFSSEGL